VAAEEAELVHLGLAVLFVAQALGQEQQAPLEGDASQGLAPGGVADEHGDEVAEPRLARGPRDHAEGVALQLVEGQGRHELLIGHVAARRGQQPLTLGLGGRHAVMRRPRPGGGRGIVCDRLGLRQSVSSCASQERMDG